MWGNFVLTLRLKSGYPCVLPSLFWEINELNIVKIENRNYEISRDFEQLQSET